VSQNEQAEIQFNSPAFAHGSVEFARRRNDEIFDRRDAARKMKCVVFPPFFVLFFVSTTHTRKILEVGIGLRVSLARPLSSPGIRARRERTVVGTEWQGNAKNPIFYFLKHRDNFSATLA